MSITISTAAFIFLIDEAAGNHGDRPTSLSGKCNFGTPTPSESVLIGASPISRKDVIFVRPRHRNPEYSPEQRRSLEKTSVLRSHGHPCSPEQYPLSRYGSPSDETALLARIHDNGHAPAIARHCDRHFRSKFFTVHC